MVLVLLAGAVLVVLNQTLLSPALPYIMDHLNVDATTVQWLTSAYGLTEAIVIPLAAWFMGRFRTRRLFIGGMTLFAAGSLVAALSPNFAVLLVGRIMQAMSTGVLMVMVMSLILLSFPRESRGQAMGLVSLVIAFAPAIGPSLGGFLVDMVGWRALFVVVVVLALLVIVFAARTLVNYDGFPRTVADVPSIVLSTLGLALLLYGLSSFASSTSPGLCVALIVVGVVFLALFVKRQFSIEEPMLRLEVLKSRRYRTACFTMCALEAVLIGLGVLMPLYIQNVLGFSATVSGLVTLPGAVIGAIAGLIAGRMFDRSGVRGVAVLSVIVLVIGAIGMMNYQATSTLAFVIAFNILTNIGLQLLFTPLNTWGVNSLDNDLVQHATSVTNTMNQVGGSLGTALIMSFSALGSSMSTASDPVQRVFDGYHMSFGVVLVLSVIVLLSVLFFVRDKKTDVAPASVRTAKEGSYLVSDVMDTNPLSIPANASVGQAARALASSDASGAAVVDGAGKVCGFLSNSDILRLFGDRMESVAGASGFTALRTLDDEDVKERAEEISDMGVMEVATKQVIGISSSATFEEACLKLAEKRLKSLPVIDNGKLVGVVRRRSLMQRIAGAFAE
jgi:DHA2 family multidrug resistance protein-like MFS transporter